MRIMQRRDLYAVVIDQFGAVIKPAILFCLPVKEGAGIWRREGYLYRMRIDFLREIQRFADGFFAFARQSENKGAVNHNPKIVAVFGELARNLNPHALLDVVKDLLIAGLIANQK